MVFLELAGGLLKSIFINGNNKLINLDHFDDVLSEK